MSVVKINGHTYSDVEVNFNNGSAPKSITFIMNKGKLDLDEVAADFSAQCNVITVDDEDYTGYIVFKSIVFDLKQIVVHVAQKSVEEQLIDANKEIEELQDATAAIIEMIGG